MSAESTHSEHRAASINVLSLALLLMLLAPIVYVFSVGPIVYLANAAQLPDDSFLLVALSGFYYPLEWLNENNQAAEAFFDWYINLWDL